MSENPYAPPGARVDQADQNAGPSQGSLQRGVEGTYVFSIGGVVSEAWRRVVAGNKLVCLVSALVAGLSPVLLQEVLALGGIDGRVLIERGDWLGGMAVSALSGMLLLPITAPLQAGVYMIGIRVASGQRPRITELFAHFGRLVDLTIVGMLQTIAVYVGLLLFILPGVYLAVALQLATPLVVEKKLTPLRALEASRRAITHHWFGFAGLGIVLGVLVALGAIPFGLGLIWTLPLAVVSAGIVYRLVFGVGESP